MNKIEEIMQAIFISLAVATFLLNTGRALKAIELCKESLVLQSNKVPSVEKKIGKIIYERIYGTMFIGYCLINDNTNAITCGRKLLTAYRECGDRVHEKKLGVILAKMIYWSQSKYVEAKEIWERVVIINKETDDKLGEAECYRNLGCVFKSLGQYVKAKEFQENALAISLEMSDREGEARCHGNLGVVLQSVGEHVKAKEQYEKALKIQREIGNRTGEAICYGNLGTVFRSVGEFVKAKEYHEKALAISMEISDRQGEARCYGNLGNVFQSLGQYVKAKEYYEKSLAIRMKIGDKEGEATDYGNLGPVLVALGEYVKAKDYLQKALANKMEIGDRAGEASCYGNLGTVFQSLGHYVKAKEFYEKALAITTEIGDKAREASWYGNLGTVLQYLGQYVKAKEYYEKALAIEKNVGNEEGQARNYGNIGGLFQALGECVQAKEYFEKALKIKIEIGDRQGEAYIYTNLGALSLSLRKYRNSKEYYDKALAIFIEIGSIAQEAMVYGNLGILLQSLGDNIKAKEYYEKSLAITLQIGNRKQEAINYCHLGSVFQTLHEYAMAEEYFEKALLIVKNVRCSEIELRCSLCLTFTKLSQGKVQEAFSYLCQSIKKCEDLRGVNGESDHIKISLADKHSFPYQLLGRLFCAVGNSKTALNVVELGRARALADLMATQYSAEKHISADPQSWTGIENFVKIKGDCTCLYISYDSQEVFLWLLEKSGAIHFRKITVEEKILHTRLAKVARNLNEFFIIMAESFRSFGILPEEICEDRSLNDTGHKLKSCQEENPETFRRGKDKDGPKPSLTLFYQLLISPVIDLLDEPEIIIVPDRDLYRVPFPALLNESGEYLSETFRIRVLPSLTTLKLIQESPADYHSQTGALIVGDPDVGEVIYRGNANKKFVPLPGARKEAEMIGQLLGVKPLLGQHATKQAVLERINSVSLIHIAAHGNAERGEIALAPAVLTTQTPHEDDYLLKMSDILQVQVRAKLVVLSCCHSGRGQIRAEGVVGIARAFLGSGARSVLVALWALEDKATKQLMSRFYEHLARGVSVSECLHEAMKWMRENSFTKVHEWAPFMLIGDNVSFAFGKK